MLVLSKVTKQEFSTYTTPLHAKKSHWILYLLECILCNLQYVSKSETSFNIRLNNHRKDVSNLKTIPTCLRFRKKGYSFI